LSRSPEGLIVPPRVLADVLKPTFFNRVDPNPQFFHDVPRNLDQVLLSSFGEQDPTYHNVQITPNRCKASSTKYAQGSMRLHSNNSSQAKERRQLHEIIKKGSAKARMITRCRILLLSEPGRSQHDIAEALSIKPHRAQHLSTVLERRSRGCPQ
jgi:hypothetical protein